MPAIGALVGGLLLAAASAPVLASGAPARRAAGSADSNYACGSETVQIFGNFNTEAVGNGGAPPSFTTDGPFCLTEIETYHWNGGTGATPGTLGLTGTEVAPGFVTTAGPFSATGASGQTNAPYVDWVADVRTEPSPVVIDGTYTCQDSSPSTWSQNPQSGGLGFCEVDGSPATQVTTTTATTVATSTSRSTTTTTRRSVTPRTSTTLSRKKLTTTTSSTTTTTTTPLPPNGTFDNPYTAAGWSTQKDPNNKKGGRASPDGPMTLPRTREKRSEAAIEMVYQPGPRTSQCTSIEDIQVLWVTDPQGGISTKKAWMDAYGGVLPTAAGQDAVGASTGGYSVDNPAGASTPYYQDAGKGKLTNGVNGSSDGHGGGTPSDITDSPTQVAGWTLHFEVWAVCTAGTNAGEVLAGMTWEETDAGARITGYPPKPSDHFEAAVKSWEKWYDDNHPSAPYTEPGGGFKW